MKNKNLFTLDFSKDSKLIGKTFTLNHENEKVKVKFVDINYEGYYIFKITNKNSDLDEFSTRVPNDGDIT